MTVAPRPMSLLWLTASLAFTVTLGTAAFLFHGHLGPLPKNILPILIGVAVGETIIAILLRLTVRIVLRFDFAFIEALLVTIFVTALNALALAPAALVRLAIFRPEQSAKLLPITGAASLLLTVVAYAYLIRNAHGRPIGVGRGVLVAILQFVFLALIIGGVFALVTRVWPSA
jgi:hypothetical protein